MSEIKDAFGIKIGDLIWIERDNCPNMKYEITGITKPVLFNTYGSDIYLYSQSVIHISARDIGKKGKGDASFGTVRMVSGRYFDAMNFEVKIEKRSKNIYQRDLFSFFEDQQEPQPYPFQNGVDYQKGIGFVWKCDSCGVDFNTTDKSQRPTSHDCDNYYNIASPIYYFNFPAEITNDCYPSPFICSLNFQAYEPSGTIRNESPTT